MDENTEEKGISVTEADDLCLSPTREKILQALINPEFAGLNVTERCQRIDISRQAWYNAKHDPKFMEIVNKMQYDMLRDSVSGAMSALIKSASNPSPKSNPDRRLLFELTGHSVKELIGQNIIIVNVRE